MEENLQTEETVEEKEYIIEQLPYNKHDVYIPTEWKKIDYLNSWKQCHCGKQIWLNDNYCARCGQRIGMPEHYYD